MTDAHPAAADQVAQAAQAVRADPVDPVETVETTTKIATTVTPAEIVTFYGKCASEINSSTEDKWKCWILSQASRTPTVAEGDPEKSPHHLWLGIQQ